MRRGFALPLVLALVVIGSLLTAAVLQRFAGQRMRVQRQLDAYVDHHVARGLQEAIGAWTQAAAGQELRLDEMLGEEGRALDLRTPQGAPVSIYLAPAQGPLLADFAGLNPTDTTTAARALLALREISGAERAVRLIRREGPLAIAVADAPPEALQAACRGVLDTPRGDELYRELLRVRDLPDFDAPALVDAYAKANIQGEDLMRIQSILVARASLWMAVAETQSSSGELIRYRGLITLRTGAARGNRTTGGVTRTSTPFLTWERVYDTSEPRFAGLPSPRGED